MASRLTFALLFLTFVSLSVALDTAYDTAYTSTRTVTHNTTIGNLSFTTEPRGRGTVGLLFSCIVTFAFCVWTAVHPNIIVDATERHRIFYKTVLMIISILVPEGVILCAYGQRREALRLHKAWQRKYPEQRDYLGMDGAFFVVMGGFVIDRVRNDSVNQHVRSRRRKQSYYTATLTPAGFLCYLESGQIDHRTFDKRDIVDKGKADTIAKLISSSQALWLFVQCLARWKARLPLTLVRAMQFLFKLKADGSKLEIHVLIQVVCTLIIYICWWKKPLDAYNPIRITISSIHGTIVPLQGKTEMELKELEAIRTPRPMNRPWVVKQRPSGIVSVTSKAFYDITIYVDQNDPEEVESADIELRHRYLQVYTLTPSIQAKDTILGMTPMHAGGVILGLVGLLHAAAWNVHFPTVLEKWLWRGCSIGMCLFPFGAVFIATFTLYQRDMAEGMWQLHLQQYNFLTYIPAALVQIHMAAKEHSKRGRKRRINILLYLWHLIMIIICCAAMFAYTFCIVIITVESYISLRDPPERSMITPRWSDYWKHF